jgi:outer membrane protein OmpA-like peptidoglycan-associated protein
LVFPPDNKPVGIWWQKGAQENSEFVLTGTKKADQPARCGDGVAGVEDQVAKDLADFGRARVYGVNFDTDSDKIKDESTPTLDKIVAILSSRPELKITVEGHTDSTSTPEHNQDLSERRAAAVKNYLVTAGIDSSRLSAAGFGATRPVAGNDNELGRAQNRRVELAKF